MYSSTLSLTSALDGVGDQRHASADLPLGNTGTHCMGGWGGPQSRSGCVRKSRPSLRSVPRSFQPVASRYTD